MNVARRKTGITPAPRSSDYCWSSQGGTSIAVLFVFLCCGVLTMRPPLKLATMLPVIFCEKKEITKNRCLMFYVEFAFIIQIDTARVKDGAPLNRFRKVGRKIFRN